MAAALLTRETARERAAKDYQVVYRMLLLAQAEAIEWVVGRLIASNYPEIAKWYQIRADQLRKEAQ